MKFVCISILFAALLPLISATFSHPEHWTRVGRSAATDSHTVAFVVKQNTGAHERGDRLLKEIHTTGSPKHLRYLPLHEVTEMFVNQTAVSLVESFLNASSISYSTRGHIIWATASIDTLDALLDAEFHAHSHENFHTHAHKTETYTIPAQIKNEVSAILNTQDLPAARPPKSANNSNNKRQSKRDEADPYVLRSLYQVPNVRLTSTVSQGILGGNSGFFKSDLADFFSSFGSTASPDDATVFTYTTYDESQCYNVDCGESALDMQYSMAMAPGIKTVYFYSSGDGVGESINWLATASDVPTSFSTSLSFGSTGDYAETYCSQILQAALRGVTYFSASGDGGGYDSDCNIYATDFPTACPYVVAVGGTQGPESGDPEEVWGGSGAGSSEEFPMPDWQVTFAQEYFAQGGSRIPSNFDRTRRLWPDVAAVASDLPLYFRGDLSYAAGTSFASPIFAGILSQVNAYRVSHGLGTLGYLNQILSDVIKSGNNPLNDITSGQSNGGCSNGPNSFIGLPGWDMGTGWGTPNYPKMIQILGTYTNTTTPTPAPTPSPTSTPAPSPTSTPAPSPTSTPAPSPTTTPAPSPTSTPAPSPTSTPTPAPTPSPTASPVGGSGCSATYTLTPRAGGQWNTGTEYDQIYEIVIMNRGSCTVASANVIISNPSAITQTWNYDKQTGKVDLYTGLQQGQANSAAGFVASSMSSTFGPLNPTFTYACDPSCPTSPTSTPSPSSTPSPTSAPVSECSAAVEASVRSTYVSDGYTYAVYDLSVYNTGKQSITDLQLSIVPVDSQITQAWNIQQQKTGAYEFSLFGSSLSAGSSFSKTAGFIAKANTANATPNVLVTVSQTKC